MWYFILLYSDYTDLLLFSIISDILLNVKSVLFCPWESRSSGKYQMTNQIIHSLYLQALLQSANESRWKYLSYILSSTCYTWSLHHSAVEQPHSSTLFYSMNSPINALILLQHSAKHMSAPCQKHPDMLLLTHLSPLSSPNSEIIDAAVPNSIQCNLSSTWEE